jgi:uncharacterized membrane protein (UPF0127 family)
MAYKGFVGGLLIGILIALAAVGFYFYWYYYRVPSPTYNVKIKDKLFNLEIADTTEERTLGLMNRKYLREDGGMLFIFEKTGWYPFWMKNTYIPLDIIWLNENKEVVHIKEEAQPCASTSDDLTINPLTRTFNKVKQNIPFVCDTILPVGMSKYVIELKSGKVKEIDLKIGDKTEFDISKL